MTDTRPVLLCIVGMVRSGSTFLEGRIADLCAGVAVGELVGSWGAFARGDVLCSCGQPAEKCPFWARVRDVYPGVADPETIAYMTGVNRGIMPIRRLRTWLPVLAGRTTGFDRYQREARALVSAVGWAADDLGYRLVVDSSKHPVFFALIHTRPFPEFAQRLCVRLVRDPRGVSYSLQRPQAEVTAAGGEFAMKGYSAWRTVPFWVALNLASDRVVPSSAIRLRYEDLGKEVYREWLEAEGVSLVGGSGLTSRHQLVANPARQGGERPFFLDERWRQGPRLRSMLIGAASLPWMRRYGYSVGA